MTKTWFLGDCRYSNISNITQYERRNPKTEKLVKNLKGTCRICRCNQSQILTK